MKKILTLIAGIVLLAACSAPDREKEINNIAEHEQMPRRQTSSIVDRRKAIELLALYRKFADDFPEDSLAPALHDQGMADICINLGNNEEGPRHARQRHNPLPRL